MNTKEIKLPPYPEGLCLREDIEDYARAAVEADRAARNPLVRADYENHGVYLGCTSVVMRYGFESGVRFAERHHGITED